MNRALILLTGVGFVLAETAVWHGPLGKGDAFAGRIDARARRILDRYEMTQVQAHLERGPLSRRMILSGPADAFQRAELMQIMAELPGVSEARWDAESLPVEAVQ